MSRNRLLLIGAVVVVGLGLWWLLRSGAENVAVDLVQQLPGAKQQPNAEAFTVADATLNNQTKRAVTITEAGGTRITWHVTVPESGWLKTSFGVLEPGWTMTGDGVLFMIGVSDGKHYDELVKITVDPFTNQSDRRWIDFSVDLSQYAGEAVDIIFNTRPGTKDDRNGDLPVWGEPRIVVQ